MAEKVFLGRAAVPDNPDGTPNEDRVFLERDDDAVTRSLESGDPTEYFVIRKGQPATTLQKVTLKPGQRAPGRALEIAVIVAGGRDVGDAEVEK